MNMTTDVSKCRAAFEASFKDYLPLDRAGHKVGKERGPYLEHDTRWAWRAWVQCWAHRECTDFTALSEENVQLRHYIEDAIYCIDGLPNTAKDLLHAALSQTSQSQTDTGIPVSHTLNHAEQASHSQIFRAALADLVKTARRDLEEGRYIAAEAMLQVIESTLSTPATDCGNCHKCLEFKLHENGLPVTATRMILCPECGNKRCPKATDHLQECTGSNEPGQPGSYY